MSFAGFARVFASIGLALLVASIGMGLLAVHMNIDRVYGTYMIGRVNPEEFVGYAVAMQTIMLAFLLTAGIGVGVYATYLSRDNRFVRLLNAWYREVFLPAYMAVTVVELGFYAAGVEEFLEVYPKLSLVSKIVGALMLAIGVSAIIGVFLTVIKRAKSE